MFDSLKQEEKIRDHRLRIRYLFRNDICREKIIWSPFSSKLRKNIGNHYFCNITEAEGEVGIP